MTSEYIFFHVRKLHLNTLSSQTPKQKEKSKQNKSILIMKELSNFVKLSIIFKFVPCHVKTAFI